MTQEDKELLLKDLCARLPYNPMVEYKGGVYNVLGINHGRLCLCLCKPFISHVLNESPLVEEVKPYLFPLSSMTEEQKEELFKLCEFCIREDWEGKKSEVYAIEIASRFDPAYCYDHNFNLWNIDMRAINWFLKNHFDICGLIPKSLAIDATGKNIY